MVTVLELGASVSTVAILSFLIGYVVLRNGIRSRTTLIFAELAGGAIIAALSYIIGYIYQNSSIYSFVDCVTFRMIVFGISITSAGLFHLVSVFPRKIYLYNAVPSVYIFSYFIGLIGLFTSLIVRCTPSGGVRNFLWPAYLIWVSLLFLVSVGALHYSYATAPTKLQKLQGAYMLIGLWVALIWAGAGQLLPTFVPGLHFTTAIFSLPVAGTFITVAIVKYKMLLVNVEKEQRRRERRRVDVREGVINLVVNEHAAFLAFRELSARYPGLVLTIKPPNVIRERYGIEKSPVIWLTYFPHDYPQGISPDKLFFEVMYSIINFVERGGRVVLLHGLEYLVESYGRNEVLEFVYEVNRLAENLTIILAINSDVGGFEGIADHLVIERMRVDDPKVLAVSREELIGRENMIIITAKKASQIKAMYGEKNIVLELTKSFSPDRLVFEGMDRIKRVNAGDVFFECFDFILASTDRRRVLQFLKDVMDVVLYSGHRVYVLKTSRIQDYPSIQSLIETEIS